MKLATARPPPIAPWFDPRTKVLALLLTSVLLVVLERPLALATVAAACCAAMLATRPAPRTLAIVCALIVLGVWGTMLGQSIFYAEFPRTPLVVLVTPTTPVLGPLTGGVALYAEGFHHGGVQSLRLVAAVCLGLALVWSTDARDLVRALTAMHVPYGLAFMTLTAVRFLPVVLEEARTIALSRRLRGFRLWTDRPWRTWHNLLSTVRPLFFSNLRRATVLADSIESRAFSPAVAARTALATRWRSRPRDVIIAMLLVAVVAAVLTAKACYLLYRSGWVDAPALRWLYAFAREQL
ncbi:MAG: energy-coupling factor transporter transmembrane component T [Planctomycetota bacterium]